jgi:hypothetical protein
MGVGRVRAAATTPARKEGRSSKFNGSKSLDEAGAESMNALAMLRDDSGARGVGGRHGPAQRDRPVQSNSVLWAMPLKGGLNKHTAP